MGSRLDTGPEQLGLQQQVSALSAELKALRQQLPQLISQGAETALSTLVITGQGCQISGHGRGMKIIILPPQGGTIQGQMTCDPDNPGQAILQGTVNFA